MNPVVKSGSMWQGEIVSVNASGNPVTNFKMDEVIPLAEKSKLWIEFEKNKATLRGLASINASNGFVEIIGAAGKIPFAVGDRVTVHFRS